MDYSEVIQKRQSIRRYKDGDVPDEVIRELVGAARLAPSGKNMQNWHFIVIRRREMIDRIAGAVLERNEDIARRIEEREPGEAGEEAANRFRKFVRGFTLFFTNAPVLIVVMGQTYLPSGHREMQRAGFGKAELEKHAYLASPGMQSVGAAVEHLMLKTVELGYGGCWLTSANYAADLIEDIVKNEAGFSYALQKDEKIPENGYVIGGVKPDNETPWFMAALVSIGVPEEGAKSPPRKDLDDIMTFVR